MQSEKRKQKNRAISRSLPQDIKTEPVEKNNCLFDFKGGDRLKFGDVVVAVASLAVIYILIYSVLGIALVPMNTFWGLNVAFFVSVLVSASIVGYVFAGKMREESRMVSMGKVAVLFSSVIMLIVIGTGAVGHSGALVDENLQNMYDTSSWTNMDWVAYETVVGALNTSINILLALALSFIGLYLGSMHTPSAKTKE